MKIYFASLVIKQSKVKPTMKYLYTRASLVAQLVENLPAMHEMLVWFLDWEDPLEEGWATHSSNHGLPWWLRRQRICKESACNAGDLGSVPGLRGSPRGEYGSPLQYSCLENPHGQRSLAVYNPGGRKESDATDGAQHRIPNIGRKQIVTGIVTDSDKCCWNIEELELTHTTTGDIIWFNNFGILVGNYLLKLNIYVSCDSAVLLLGIYLPEMCIDIHGKTYASI